MLFILYASLQSMAFKKRSFCLFCFEYLFACTYSVIDRCMSVRAHENKRQNEYGSSQSIGLQTYLYILISIHLHTRRSYTNLNDRLFVVATSRVCVNCHAAKLVYTTFGLS